MLFVKEEAEEMLRRLRAVVDERVSRAMEEQRQAECAAELQLMDDWLGTLRQKIAELRAGTDCQV